MKANCIVIFSIAAIACPGALFGQAPAQAPAAAAPAEITVSGDIPLPVTLTLSDLRGMPRETVTVVEEDGSKAAYEGVPLREVLAKAGAPMGKQLRGKNLASYIIAKARDGYQVAFTLGELDTEFGNAPIIVADQRDGKPLFGYQGPLRIVCANDKAGARSLRMLEAIEIVRPRK